MPQQPSSNLQNPRVLLAGVFGPYGVDDAFGRRENVMELFHNQVTREQGAASFRFQHRSFGLYFIAANIEAEVTVLDFPSRDRFIQEIQKDYDIVGISFIAPNLGKAQEMARLVREHSPRSVIVLGGHGAAIEDVSDLVDCDHVVRGEGISWMRRFLGQNPDAPIIHPVLPSTEKEWILGVPLPGICASLLVPGLGCVNACRFCATSHFFDRRYTPFISSGKEMFQVARRIADARGTDDFFVMDENFLKDTRRANELLEEMERHNRFFQFQVFSSAEAILAFGLDNLVRLGVSFVWMGVECKSQQENFPKNHGVDPKALIRELRDRGIVVLASGILCMEHHTQENIQDEIDYLVSLEADLAQFMLLTPLPTTQLYLDLKDRGLLRDDLPFAEWHGQKLLSYRHPSFPGDSAERWLRRAFRQDFEVNSSSMLRVTDTALRGVLRLAGMEQRDACLEKRLQQARERAREWSHMLPTLARHGVNELERSRARALDERQRGALGPLTLRERAIRAAVRLLAARFRLRTRLLGDRLQPATLVTHYPSAPGQRQQGAPPARLPDRGSAAQPRQQDSAPRVRSTGT